MGVAVDASYVRASAGLHVFPLTALLPADTTLNTDHFLLALSYRF